MNACPFYTDGPADCNHFIGRTAQLEFIRNEVVFKKKSIAITGEIMTGKTSVFERIQQSDFYEYAGSKTEPLFVYMDLLEFQPGKLNYEYFWEEFFIRLEYNSFTTNRFFDVIRNEIENCREKKFHSVAVKKLIDTLEKNNKHLIILLDDFQIALDIGDTSLFAVLRNLNRSKTLSLVFASRFSLKENKLFSESFMGTKIEERVLAPFFLDEIPEFLRMAGGRFHSEEEKFIMKATEGHPYLLQVISEDLWNQYENKVDDMRVRLKMAAQELYDKAEVMYDIIWDGWNSEKRIAIAMIALSELPEIVSQKQFDADVFYDEINVFKKEIRFLEEHGNIQKTNIGSTKYQVKPPVFMWWIAGKLPSLLREPVKFYEWLKLHDHDTILREKFANIGKAFNSTQDGYRKMVLRYLHLSDFHFKASKVPAVEPFNQNIVVNSLVETVHKQAENDEIFDFIIITGDIADRGKQQQYEVAEAFCQKLLKAIKLPVDRLYLVPGNHDVNRDEVKPDLVKLYKSFNKEDEISESLIKPEMFSILMCKFRAFNDFAEQAMGERYFNEKTCHFVHRLRLEKNGRIFQINLAGLNSALFAGYGGDDEKKLALGLPQVEPALEQLDNNANAALSIGFFHHPFDTFNPADTVCQNRLQDKFDLILTGHVHKASMPFIAGSKGKAVNISTGAVYETRESFNSFNLVEIDLNTGQGEAQFYKYLPDHNCWIEDFEINPPDNISLFNVDKLSDLKGITAGQEMSLHIEELMKDDINSVISKFIEDVLK